MLGKKTQQHLILRYKIAASLIEVKWSFQHENQHFTTQFRALWPLSSLGSFQIYNSQDSPNHGWMIWASTVFILSSLTFVKLSQSCVETVRCMSLLLLYISLAFFFSFHNVARYHSDFPHGLLCNRVEMLGCWQGDVSPAAWPGVPQLGELRLMIDRICFNSLIKPLFLVCVLDFLCLTDSSLYENQIRLYMLFSHFLIYNWFGDLWVSSNRFFFM